jgi:hypothetical protein
MSIDALEKQTFAFFSPIVCSSAIRTPYQKNSSIMAFGHHTIGFGDGMDAVPLYEKIPLAMLPSLDAHQCCFAKLDSTREGAQQATCKW